MKQFKIISLFLIISFIFSLLPIVFNQSVKAEDKNPLKIEKVIGLSKTPGTFRNAQGVAVAKDGSIFIADTGESQIEVFDSNYKYLRSFGSIGSGDGQFQVIEQIRFDVNENLYVLDSFLCRIQVFSKDGKLLRTFGEKGNQQDQLNSPNDFDFMKTGELLVVDNNNGLKVFSGEGKFVRNFFKDKKYNSKEFYFNKLAIDKNGYMYIDYIDFDSFSYFYVKFSQEGDFVCNFVKDGKEEKDIIDYLGCKSIDDKYLYLTDGNAIKKYEILEDPKKPLQFVETIIKETKTATDKTSIMDPSALVCSKQKIYFLDLSLNRLTVYNDKKEVLGSLQSPIMEYGNMYPKGEIPKDTLSKPRGIVIGPDSNYYVVNTDYNKINIFDAEWKEINSLGKPISGKSKVLGELDEPFDIVFDKLGFCYVSDRSSDSIEIFTKDLQPFKSFSIKEGEPLGLAINSLGFLVVCISDYPDSVEIFDISKIQEKKITQKKKLSFDDYAYDIVDVVIDDQDNMIVSLLDSNEIVWISTDGEVIKKLGDRDESNVEKRIINSPRGLFLDGAGNIYVTEPYDQRIQKFSSDGNLIWKSDLGWYSLSYFAMDSQGKLYVTDMVHNVVLVINDETAIPPVPIEPKPLQTDAEFSITISKENLIEDDPFTVYVKADQLEKCSSLSISIQYPKDLISYQSYKLGSIFSDTDFKVTDSSVDSGVLSFSIKSTKRNEINDSGILFEIQFAANNAGTGMITFNKIMYKNSMDREVLYKNKKDLNFSIRSKDITPPLIKLNPIPEFVYVSPIIIQGETESDAVVSVNKKQTPVNPDGTFSAVIELQKGENKIEVTATDKAENKSEATITVVYKDRIIIKLVVGSKLIIIKGEPGVLDSEPFIDKVSGRTMVPLRAIAEAIGATVNYDPLIQKINIIKGEILIQLWIGKPKAVVNGKEVPIDPQKPLSPVIVKGRTFLPLRFIAETFEFKVDWDPKTQGITLTYPDPGKE